jgi:hypothetical protein
MVYQELFWDSSANNALKSGKCFHLDPSALNTLSWETVTNQRKKSRGQLSKNKHKLQQSCLHFEIHDTMQKSDNVKW